MKTVPSSSSLLLRLFSFSCVFYLFLLFHVFGWTQSAAVAAPDLLTYRNESRKNKTRESRASENGRERKEKAKKGERK
jgi:hypothetical protein